MFLVQCGLIFIAYNKFFVHPDNYMFMNHGDGFKNYYTLHAYLQQPEDVDFWKFEQMNYPYGDYIFYTDNTPLLAVSLKLFSRYIYDVSDHGVFILTWFCILGVLFSTLLCWKILSRFIRHNWMLFLFSICFVWLNPQMLRMKAGHLNLSFSWLILLTFWWLIRLAELKTGERNKAIRLSVYLFLTIVAGSFLHLYYAMILSVIVVAFFAAQAFKKRKNLKAASLQLLWGAGTALTALIAVLGIIRSIDTYYALRKSVPEGYDFHVWRLKIIALLKNRDWNTIPTPFSTSQSLIHESGVYLGAFCVYGLMALLVLFLFQRIEWRKFLSKIRENPSLPTQIMVFLLFAGFLSLMIAWGEKHYLFGTKHKVYNILNPFLYLGWFTDSVKQFRCLGRFSWPFYWVISFALLYAFQYFWEQGINWRKAVIVLLCAFAIMDTVNFIHVQNNYMYGSNNLTNSANQQDAVRIASKVNPTDYQAILPLPYYHNGSEDYNYTSDPPEDFYIFAVQVAENTGLPCMGSKMSRTPPAHPKAFLSIFLEDKPAPELLDKLTDQPILVLVDKKHFSNNLWFNLRHHEPVRTAVDNMPKTIEKYEMTLLYEEDRHALYRWDVK